MGCFVETCFGRLYCLIPQPTAKPHFFSSVAAASGCSQCPPTLAAPDRASHGVSLSGELLTGTRKALGAFRLKTLKRNNRSLCLGKLKH